MYKVVYETYSKILGKRFTNVKYVNSMKDFELFAMSLNLDYYIISSDIPK